MWPKFLRRPPIIDPETILPMDDSECSVADSHAPESKSAKPKHWTLAQLRKKRNSLLARVERENAKEKERASLLEECRSLAQQLEAMKTKTYSV